MMKTEDRKPSPGREDDARSSASHILSIENFPGAVTGGKEEREISCRAKCREAVRPRSGRADSRRGRGDRRRRDREHFISPARRADTDGDAAMRRRAQSGSSSPSSPRICPSRHLPADRRVEAELYVDMPDTDTLCPSDRHVADSGIDPRPSVEPSRSTGVSHPRTSHPSSAPRTRSPGAGDLRGVASPDRPGGGGAHAGRVRPEVRRALPSRRAKHRAGRMRGR